MLTNLGLVEFVKKARDEKAGYVWGTFGLVLTQTILDYKLKQYPDMIKPNLDFIKKNYMGKRTYDCVGLIKGYIWMNDEDPEYYSPATDIGANEMYEKAKIKGPIESMPDIPGICVRFPGHIGVYVGDGKVIEARATKYGVVETHLKDRPWTHWLECPLIKYEDSSKVREGVRKGDKGNDVIAIQRTLNYWGSSLAVDGVFGPKTEEEVKKFQKRSFLVVDGVVDQKTLIFLMIHLLWVIDNTKDRISEIIKEMSK